MDLGIAQTFLDATWMNIDIWHIEFTFAHGIILQMALHTFLNIYYFQAGDEGIDGTPILHMDSALCYPFLSNSFSDNSANWQLLRMKKLVEITHDQLSAKGCPDLRLDEAYWALLRQEFI